MRCCGLRDSSTNASCTGSCGSWTLNGSASELPICGPALTNRMANAVWLLTLLDSVVFLLVVRFTLTLIGLYSQFIKKNLAVGKNTFL